ncbi:hypothetical protein MRX96_013959 [Rhipicephalus microplus]
MAPTWATGTTVDVSWSTCFWAAGLLPGSRCSRGPRLDDGSAGVAQDCGGFGIAVQRQGDGGFLRLLRRRCWDDAGVKQLAVRGSDNHRCVGVRSVLMLGGVYVHRRRVTGRESPPALSLLRPVALCCVPGGCCVVAAGPRGASRCLFLISVHSGAFVSIGLSSGRAQADYS